jgi:predicted dehydrogenase
VEPLLVNDVEPLKAELTSFLESVRSGSTPAVSGQDGLAAVELAEAVVSAVKRHDWNAI